MSGDLKWLHENRSDDWFRFYDKSSFIGCNPVEVGKAATSRIDDLERRLGRFMALYSMFGQDDMTDAKFAAAFERVYLDVSLGEHMDRDQANQK